jgi:hypothetical protein
LKVSRNPSKYRQNGSGPRLDDWEGRRRVLRRESEEMAVLLLLPHDDLAKPTLGIAAIGACFGNGATKSDERQTSSAQAR